MNNDGINATGWDEGIGQQSVRLIPSENIAERVEGPGQDANDTFGIPPDSLLKALRINCHDNVSMGASCNVWI